ncbi:hypothetical protein [Halorhabdus sp. CUG00001]|uniref:hypothetical protein n=1 Tax=Halorhabdus sp. CUG00001 TaxID=2600297 RepID=UPI00131E412F|nr:hypothetical protein [Halorhabdus sp. CUG00001]
MRAITDDVDTDRGPPVAVPLQHVLLAVALLLVGQLLASATVTEPVGLSELALRHLFLAGFVGVTIMGAMTQFVPVWSGVSLYSRRLSVLQVWLVVAGLLGFVAAFLTVELAMLHVAGTLLVAGFWVFVYNVARTLARARPFDVTEIHFVIALGAFLVLTLLGYLLSLDYTMVLFGDLAITRVGVASAHATIAVFGAVLLTVVGALYQLAEMFTQADDDRVDRAIKRVELLAYPVGVGLLSVGRLLGETVLAQVGVVLVVGSLALVGVFLARKLLRAQTELSPVLLRYAVVAVALFGWAALTLPTWLADPTDRLTVLGSAASEPLLLLGVLGFVVFGTLYHIVPFLIWVRTYSDKIGYEPVPMVEEMYDPRLARADFVLLLAGTIGQVAVAAVDAPTIALQAATLLFGAGVAVLAVNLTLTVHRHSTHSLVSLLWPSLSLGSDADVAE